MSAKRASRSAVRAVANARAKTLPAQRRFDSARLGPTIYVPEHILCDPDMSGFGKKIHLRLDAYDQLLDHAIPWNLIEALKDIHDDPITWVTKDGRPIGETDKCAIPVVEPRNYQKLQTDLRNYHSDGVEVPLREPLPKTAAEALAMCLRERLAALKRAPKGSASVRRGKMLSRSEIATVAIDLLALCRASRRVPYLHLEFLIKELLDVDRPKASMPENFMARYQASWIYAQLPEARPSVVARMVGVPTSSISRWRKDRRFKNEVNKVRQFFTFLRERNLTWEPNHTIGSRVPVREKRY